MSEHVSCKGTLCISDRFDRPDLLTALATEGIARHAIRGRTIEDVVDLRAPMVMVIGSDLLDATSDLLAQLPFPATPTHVQLIVLGDGTAVEPDDGLAELFFLGLPTSAPDRLFLQTVRNAFRQILLRRQTEELEAALTKRSRELEQLNEIGIALSAEHNLDTLLDMILRKSREITRADAGSLYLLEETEDEKRQLRFKLSQNDSFDLSYQEFTMPMSKASLAGYVAVTGESLRLADVYEIPDEVDYGFNRSFDESTGYRTKSMLVVPMKNNRGEVLGVIQLINRKRTPQTKLFNPDLVEENVIEFDPDSQELVTSLASQAAVALENNILYKQLEDIFEGFLKASVKAIELRDPTTSGHSERVATLTVALAETVNRIEVGPYKNLVLTPAQIKELRYASLLHDVGKIGVREHVLLKAKKLYDHHLMLINDRFEFAKRTLESEYSKRKLDFLLEQGREDYVEQFQKIDEEFQRELESLDRYFQTILLANEPTVLEEKSFARLAEIAAQTYIDLYGHSQKLLQEEEVRILSIRRGSLDEAERREIESHVAHSYHFLRQIPWTKDLRNIPHLAYGHHERLDGTGYPNRLTSEQLAPQTKMMTIADIFDALTASDRPYKKAVPIERALDILRYEVEDGHIDGTLVDIFITHRLFELVRLK